MMPGPALGCPTPAGTLSGALLTGFAAAEIGLLCLAAMSLFTRNGYSLAESAAAALVTPLMALSLLYQLAFIAGMPAAAAACEAVVCLAALSMLILFRRELTRTVTVVRGFAAAHGLPAILLAGLWGYLVLHALAGIPSAEHRDFLLRVVSWETAGTFFGSAAALPDVPLNTMVLPHLFLRLGTCRGVDLFGLMAYLSIGCATYALARRHAWPPTAFTVALVTVSLPRLVFLSASPGLEIVPAAAAVFSMLILYRLIERPATGDLVLLVCAILFSMPAEKIFYLMPAILTLLSLVLLIRRHGTLIWHRRLLSDRWAAPAAVVPALIFSQVWRLAAPSPAAAPALLATSTAANYYQSDGIQGALANLLRYFLQCADFTAPVDRLGHWVTGVRPTAVLQGLYNRVGLSLFGQLGASATFTISWPPSGSGAWFGPFAFLILLPALCYALAKGSRRLKAVAVALLVYVYTICLVCAWTPYNARLFTAVFACSGFCAAFLLPPWRFSRRANRSLQALSLLLLVYAAAHTI